MDAVYLTRWQAIVIVAGSSMKSPNFTKTKQRLETERCRRSAHYFIFDSTRLVTKDEHDAKEPVKPFPDSLYLRALLDTLLVSGRLLAPESAALARRAGHSLEWLHCLYTSGMLAVEKSRQMMVTWLVCAYCLWRMKDFAHPLLLL